MLGLALTASRETRNFRLIYISKLTPEYLLKDPFIHDFHDVSFEKWIRPPVHSKSQDYADSALSTKPIRYFKKEFTTLKSARRRKEQKVKGENGTCHNTW